MFLVKRYHLHETSNYNVVIEQIVEEAIDPFIANPFANLLGDTE